MRLLIVVLLFFTNTLGFCQDVPFLPLADFEFELDYNFKTKPPPEKDKLLLTENRRSTAEFLPYVRVSFRFNNLPAEAYKIRVVDQGGGMVKSKKVKKLEVLEFDLGFSDDIKDRVKPHAYYIFIEDKSKVNLSKIKIFVDESGDFYLNDELFGKI